MKIQASTLTLALSLQGRGDILPNGLFGFKLTTLALAAAFTSGQVVAATLPVACNPCSTGAAFIQPNTGTGVTTPLPTATNLTINQTSQTAVRNWQSFNAGLGGNVNFVQPNSNAGTLILAGNGGNLTLNGGGNLTLSGGNLPANGGSLTANGQIFAVNSAALGSPTVTLIAGPTYGPVAAVPEPDEWAMMLLGLALIGFITRRRENINSPMNLA